MGLVPYGLIIKTHGLKGEVCLTAFSRDFSNLEYIENIYLEINFAGGFKKYEIASYYLSGKHAVLKISGLDNINSADDLKNKTVYVDSDELSDTNEDEYYWFQIIGIQVYEKGGKFIGQVQDLLDRSQQPILIIVGTDKREILIPFADEIIKEIDLKNNKIIIDPPDGLLDIN